MYCITDDHKLPNNCIPCSLHSLLACDASAAAYFCTVQIIRVVWNAWHSFVPQAQVKRHAKGRAAAHWHRRALILSFAWWHSYAAVMKARRQQLADALLRWDTRRMWLALEGWRAVTQYKQHKQHKLAQVRARRGPCPQVEQT
jgi:hypothetical protein